ncbi:hypothetical protein [Dielma fastidiosa]|uniref:hypothetical protein n=1 Tax=Dielma fastidiosa TaxID=1034346 RepID=UPI0023F50596|nr:hypothetical protein [Dielma fastidiosa]MBS6169758.1 hypothetical protein [Bacillota bacterium]
MEIAPACDGANLTGEVMRNEKTPISCGFAGPTYGTICQLVTTETAIQAIKKLKLNAHDS